MNCSEYIQQLEQVKEALKNSTGEEKEELLSLKNSIEELLSIALENEESNEEEQNIDDEYALFLAEVNAEASSSNHEVANDGKICDNVQWKSMEGKKCKAPHINECGDKTYHNAMICSILEDQNEIKAKVLFTNPISNRMLSCPFYFDTDCKFSAEKCKYSHGEIVPFSELQDYTEPCFEKLEIGSEILAKQCESKLWKRARITKISKEKCIIRFDGSKKEDEVTFSDILPLEGSDRESDYDSEDSDHNLEVINMSLMNVPSDGVLGDWEKFTRGIGSKLMQKMGYIIGTGLGRRSDGRIDPVTAVILPAGKSLDHCMNLREKFGGDKDLFNAERKLRILQRKQEVRNKKVYEKSKQQNDVFNFLNNSLGRTESKPDSSSSSQHRKTIKSETCRNLNVASLKTDENIRKTEKSLYEISESLKRHEGVNPQMYKSLLNKLDSTKNELSNLRNEARNIKNEQNLRKDKKKMTVF